MARLIFIPQYPAPMRYQEWWIKEFAERITGFSEKIVLQGCETHVPSNSGDFSPVQQAIDWETEQIKQYMSLTLRKDDVLLLSDLSFPGLFAQVLFHKRPKYCYAICHATSKNKYDYFAADRKIKYPIEKTVAKLFNAIFVGSHYHERKLGWHNIIVTGLPIHAELQYIAHCHLLDLQREHKVRTIISVSRPGIQKRTRKLEKALGITIDVPLFLHTWEHYYQYIRESKVLFITAKEETFGYQVVDAIKNGCTVVAPNKYSYPELIEAKWLYNDGEGARIALLQALKTQEKPVLLNDNLCSNFYETLSKQLLWNLE